MSYHHMADWRRLTAVVATMCARIGVAHKSSASRSSASKEDAAAIEQFSLLVDSGFIPVLTDRDPRLDLIRHLPAYRAPEARLASNRAAARQALKENLFTHDDMLAAYRAIEQDSINTAAGSRANRNFDSH